MIQTVQILYFFIFNHIFCPSSDYDLITEIARDLPDELLETQNNRQANAELEEHFNEESLQQILDINTENIYQSQNIPQKLPEFAQQKLETNPYDFNEVSSNAIGNCWRESEMGLLEKQPGINVYREIVNENYNDVFDNWQSSLSSEEIIPTPINDYDIINDSLDELLETKNDIQITTNNLEMIIKKPRINWKTKLREMYSEEELSKYDEKELRKLKKREWNKLTKATETKEQRQKRLSKQIEYNKKYLEKHHWIEEGNKMIQDFFNNYQSTSNNQNQESNSRAQSSEFPPDHKKSGFCYCSACNKPGSSGSI